MRNIDIELVYEQSCPNVPAARSLLQTACARLGLAQHWREWELSDPNLPAHARGYGSPTILVNGRDVAGAAPGVSACCRLYNGAQGPQGVPELDQVVHVLQACAEDDRSRD